MNNNFELLIILNFLRFWGNIFMVQGFDFSEMLMQCVVKQYNIWHDRRSIFGAQISMNEF